MKYFLFAFLFFLAAPALADDGLFAVASSGEAVKTVSGKEIRLGEKLDGKIGKAFVSSQDNGNTSFFLSLEKKGAFAKDYSQMALCVSSRCVQFNSGGSSQDTDFSIGAQFEGKEAAEAFAKYFNTAPRLRKHPGHAISTRFIPSKKEFTADEAMPVTLEIKNEGTVPFTFHDGGQNRGERNNQFGFTAYDGVTAVPDTGSPVHFGGISVNKTLQPGETFTKEVDLRKWFTFRKPGAYFITGTFELDFFDPSDKNWFVLWQDFAAAKFYVTIKE